MSGAAQCLSSRRRERFGRSTALAWRGLRRRSTDAGILRDGAQADGERRGCSSAIRAFTARLEFPEFEGQLCGLALGMLEAELAR